MITITKKKNHRKLTMKQVHDKLYTYRTEHRLCTNCGKQPASPGLKRCSICNDRLNKLQRERRERISLKISDNLINRGMITTLEASQILGVCRCTILNYIKKGKLQLCAKRALIGGTTFWVNEIETRKLLSQINPNIRCSKCGHCWHTNLANPTKCPRLKCRSTKLEQLPLRNRYSRFIPQVRRLSQPEIDKMIKDRLHGDTLVTICTRYNICVKTFYKMIIPSRHVGKK